MRSPFKKDKTKENPESEQIDTGKGKIPDYRRMLQLIAGDAKGHALNQVITSDKNNAVKAIIRNVFNMSAADMLSHWEEFDSEVELLQFFLNGRIHQDEGGYRINSRAEDGKAMLQFVDGFKAWSLLGNLGAQGDTSSRLTEGDKKK